MGHCQSYPSANYPNNLEGEETTYQNLINSGMKKNPVNVVYQSGIADERQDYNLSGTMLNSTYPSQLGNAYGAQNPPGYDQAIIRSEMEGPYPSNFNVNGYNEFSESRTTQQPIIEQTNYRYNEPGSNVVNVTPTETRTNTGTSAANEMPRAAKDPGENDQRISPEKDEPNIRFTGAPAVQVDVNVNFGGGYRMKNSSVKAPASANNWASKVPKAVDSVHKSVSPDMDTMEFIPAAHTARGENLDDSPAVAQAFKASYNGIHTEVPTPVYYDEIPTEMPIADSYHEVPKDVLIQPYDEMTAGKTWQYDPVCGYNVLVSIRPH